MAASRDVADRMVCDTVEHVTEVGFQVEGAEEVGADKDVCEPRLLRVCSGSNLAVRFGNGEGLLSRGQTRKQPDRFRPIVLKKLMAVTDYLI
jgi:hypothetical protein